MKTQQTKDMENQILKEEEVLILLKNKINSLLEQGEEITECPSIGATSYRIGEVMSILICIEPTKPKYHLRVKGVDYDTLYTQDMLKEVYLFIKGKYDNIEELRKKREIGESIAYLKSI